MPSFNVSYEKVIRKSIVITAKDEDSAIEIANTLPDEDFEFTEDEHFEDDPHIQEVTS